MDNSKQQNYELDEPIGKKKPFIVGIKWFLPTFLGVLGFHWLVLEPMEVFKKIFVCGIWSWVYFVLISGLIAVLVTMSRIARYYHTIYRQYRKQALVDNLYLTRAELQGKYKGLIEKATQSIDVFGMSLHTLIQNPEIRDAIVLSATGALKVKYRFLLHDPKCRFLKERSKEEGKEEKTISDDSNRHLINLREMKDSAGKHGGKIEIGTLKDKMPDCFYFKQDDTLFIEPYLLGYTGRDCPVFCIKKNDVNAPVFDAFISAMERKWKGANK
jgi:hypothetical protein